MWSWRFYRNIMRRRHNPKKERQPEKCRYVFGYKNATNPKKACRDVELVMGLEPATYALRKQYDILQSLANQGFWQFFSDATMPFVAQLFAPNLLLFGKNYVTCHRAFSLPKIISKIIVKVNAHYVKLRALTFVL